MRSVQSADPKKMLSAKVVLEVVLNMVSLLILVISLLGRMKKT